MNKELISALLAWLPLLIIIGGGAFFIRLSWRKSAQNMERAIASNDEIVRATESVVAELREIKEILRGRK